MKYSHLFCSAVISVGCFCRLDCVTIVLATAVVAVLFIMSLVAGFLMESRMFGATLESEFETLKLRACYPLFCPSLVDSKKSLRLDKRLSGSSTIDDALQEFLQVLIRDYIENWSNLITNDVEFLYEVRSALQKIAINTSKNCKEVDWLSFLTTNVVEIIASHVRLYRQARNEWKDLKLTNKQGSDGQLDFDSLFFKLESVAHVAYNRKNVCIDSSSEKGSLKSLADLLLHLVGPQEELSCSPVQLISSQLLIGALLPLLNILSDPDFINQIVIWLCKDCQITNESYLTVLGLTENSKELDASIEMLSREIALLRSHDLGGDDDIAIKQRLSSLLYVKELANRRLQQIGDGNDHDSLDWNQVLSSKASHYSLPLEIILKNNIALSYLLDFMASLGSQAYLFFLLNAEGWKTAAEQQIGNLELQGFSVKEYSKTWKKGDVDCELSHVHQILSNMREAALSIYEQYLSEKAVPRLRVDDVAVRRLLFNICNETPNESWFDEIKFLVSEKLQKDERFMPAFMKTGGYMRLLAELEIDDDSRSLDDASNNSVESTNLYSFETDSDKDKDVSQDVLSDTVSSKIETFPSNTDLVVKASIKQKGVIKYGFSSHVVYAVTVTKSNGLQDLDTWIVYRRYSDFYCFHEQMEEKFKNMRTLEFPAKRAFNNFDKLFLERRQFLLNEYLSKLLKPEFVATCPGLQGLILQFLDRGTYDQAKSTIHRKVDNLMNPLVTSVRTVGKAVWPISSSFSKDNVRPHDDLNSYLRGTPTITPEEYDNVPLRILLVLMDEVFDLHASRNQWLKKRVFIVLREIMKAMFGDVFNQKIVDSVANLTSPEQVAEYIRVVKNSIWPNGTPTVMRPVRDDATKMRTRVAAKMSLLSCIPDEIKHLIGSETCRQGVLRVFELFQNPVLNRRLIYVILENVIETLFPKRNVPDFFEKFHSATA